MYATTSQLLTLLQQEVGDTSPDATQTTRLVNLLDEAHKEIIGGGGILNVNDRGNPNTRPALFTWAEASEPFVVTTELPVTTGSVNVTISSNSAVLSSNLSTNVTGWYFKVDGKSTVYRVSAHTVNTATLTLDSIYVDSSDTAATYVLCKLDYTFGDSNDKILVPVDYVRSYSDNKSVSLVPLKSMRSRFPLSDLSQGDPTLIGIKSFSDGQIVVQLNRYPETIQRLDLRYIGVPETLDTSSVNPVLPEEDRKLISILAAYYQMVYRDDQRAAQYLATARTLFRQLKAKSGSLLEHNDARFGYIPPFPGGFRNTRRKGFSWGDYHD